MAKRVLMQGNEACVEGAIAAGMRFYAGYPITPSTEIAEVSALRLPQVGGKFIFHLDEMAADLGEPQRAHFGDLSGRGDRVTRVKTHADGDGAFHAGFISLHQDSFRHGHSSFSSTKIA